MPSNGIVDLGTLALGDALSLVSQCEISVPADTAALRCVYADGGYFGDAVARLR
jgi:hypothetical protein